MTPGEGSTVLVHATTPAPGFEVTCDMDGLTSRAGTALLSGLADATGLTAGLREALAVHVRSVRHEPGHVVRDLAVMLADGGDCLSDLGVLREQGVLFGPVASDATAYRCVERLGPGMLARIRDVRALARARVWEHAGPPGRVILDVDATLLTAHSVHHQRAAIEDSVRCAKASGMRNPPFRAFAMNEAWLELVLTGVDLVAWARMLLLAGTELAAAEPKRLRHRLFHVAGRIVTHARTVRLRLPRDWPWARAVAAAFARLDALRPG